MTKGRWMALGLAAGAIAAAGIGYYRLVRTTGLPDPASQTYVDTARSFYRGLASLETGLVDDAKSSFTTTTMLAPAEPAGWANLGVTHLRVAEFDEAARAIGEAARYAPSIPAIAMLQGALEGARGQLDAAVMHLRRAVELAGQDPRAVYALAEMIQRAGGPAADSESAVLIDQALTLDPLNLALLVERVRLAVRRGDQAALASGVSQLGSVAPSWPPEAREQLAALQTAVDAGDLAAAARAAAFLRNVLARVPAFREGLAAVRVPAELVAEPLRTFLALPSPSPLASPLDSELTFVPTPFDPLDAPARQATVFSSDESGAPAAFAVTDRELRRLDRMAAPLPLPAALTGDSTPSLLPLDWNNDFKTDLLHTGPGGIRLWLQQDDGAFQDATPATAQPGNAPAAGAWAADVEMDGDLDVVLAGVSGDPAVLRNNANGTWDVIRPFAGVPGTRAFVWGDLDADGDPDAALLDSGGALHLFSNQQAGSFARRGGPGGRTGVVALALGDTDADGAFELITLDRAGVLGRASALGDAWRVESLANWNELPAGTVPGSYRLFLGDFDNNGAVDLLGAGGGATALWLADERHQLRRHATFGDVETFDAIDVTGDGLLDLVGVSAGQPTRLTARGTRNYHWQLIRPRAQTAAGDQRINSYGVGGEIEVRSGLLAQKQVLRGGPAHFGLGSNSDVDLARIVWPNGVMQAEFGLTADQSVVANQRLKGSCPWLFAWDGDTMGFITDVLWRSPLGLRINAQDTAGVNQTEDWVKVGGAQLQPRDGLYDLRITAELWETHFFDHVALLAVDRPAGVEVFVDERFARRPPALAIQAVHAPVPLAGVWDDAGHDVATLVAARDGRHAAGFERGRYQGVTREHGLEFVLPELLRGQRPLTLVARGWVYPTDSSINVAIGQGGAEPPRGLRLEALVGNRWTVIEDDLGFPAGKSKTMLIDLSAAPLSATRLRLRTTMEIYWDWMAAAIPAPAAAVVTTRVPLQSAELRYRGFSVTSIDAAAHAPELPHYARLANSEPRWRDLLGYHTRFGGVTELLAGVDDRYVIMNAGDEMRLAFPAQPEPAAGLVRDFIFVSDGWEKDGDFNTAFSATVLPLPSHDRPEYGAAPGPLRLEDDPVYRRYPEDWQRFHTRFVSPGRYLRGLQVR